MKFADRLKAFLGIAPAIDDGLFEDLTDLLVEGDLGAALAYEVGEKLKAACRKKRPGSAESIKLELKTILTGYCMGARIRPEPGRITVLLVVGVNGVGKTTTCAKLAHKFRSEGYPGGIVLAAGDTFRAAAIDQLKIHGERLGIRVVAQGHGSDPGAVLWDALEALKSQGPEGLLIADTAGRMHTRTDLIRELSKIDKIVDARARGATIRRVLVLDSTTGQNAYRQAEIFRSAVPIDGIVLSKHDSSGRGGMAIVLARDLGIPTAFVGTGERYADLSDFDASAFLDDFLGIGT